MKIIKLIKKNQTVEIIFENKKSLIISLDVFFQFPVGKDMVLDEEKLSKIKELQKKHDFRKKIVEYATTKKRSSFEIEKFLSQFDFSAKEKNEFSKLLIKYDLVNDRELAKLIVENQLKKANGINLIKDRLKKRYLNMYNAKDFIDQKVYSDNLFELKKSLLEKYEKYPFIRKKQKVYTSLISKGYLHDECFIDDLFYDEEKEIRIALETYEKIKKNNPIKKTQEKLVKSGFSYDIVKKVTKGE